MPALANVTANDSVPLARVFNPQKIAGGLATFLNKAGGVPLGYDVLTVSHSDASSTSKNSKTRIKLVVPRLDAEGVVVSRCSVDVTFSCDDKSTLLDRQNIHALGVNMLNSQINTLITTNESFY